MKSIDIENLSPLDRQHWLQSAIAPRPICFASTIDLQGNVNLSPFSFFNIFSIQPPIVVFSPSRRVRDNTTKHTLQNVAEVAEVVINVVDYSMIHQTSLASCEYPKTVNEFEKAGFTMQAATVVTPPMVKESKIKLECRVIEIKSLGNEGGSGNLVLAQVVKMHVDEDVIGEDNRIDPRRLELVARLGGDWYCRVNESNLFKVEKPNTQLGIGIDSLPSNIRNSSILTGNNLGQLANHQIIPLIDPSFEDDTLKNIFQYYSLTPELMEEELHRYARTLLEKGDTEAAWQVLLSL